MKPPLPTFLQHRLAREVTLAIAMKLLVIAAIYYAFFDGHALSPDADAVAERLANPNLPTQSQPPSRNSHAD